jgi:hypothetical protein
MGARLAIFLCLLGMAGAAPLRAQPADTLRLSADEPIGAWINGVPVALALTTATVDHVTLNDPLVRQLGLRPAPPDRIANLVIGGAVARIGRHGAALVSLAERTQRQEMFWFPEASPLPVDGSIGPFALPAATVSVRWGQGETSGFAWPLVGGIDRAAYGVSAVAGRAFLLGADVRMRRPLPLVTASTGADLVDALGGRLVGAPWQEEIMLGVRRPVRRLELDRPLVIGPLSFTALAVRVGGPRDGTMWLSPGQKPLPEAGADPAEILVRGRTLVRRGVARVIILSRNHLEAAGCTGLTVAKRDQRFILHCPAAGTRPPQGPGDIVTAAVPLLPPVQPLDRAETPLTVAADGWLNITADAPLAARILDQPLQLLPESGVTAGAYLNDAAVARLPIEQADWAGDFRRGAASVPMMGVFGAGVHVAGRSAPQMVAWVPGEAIVDRDLADGFIILSALPHRRVRVRLPVAGHAAMPLQLPLTRSRGFEAAGGDARLPDVRRFVLSSRLREDLPLPVASAGMAAELMAKRGGRFDTLPAPATLTFGLRTWQRTLRLARPLLIGPLRFDAVAVETDALGVIPPPPRGSGVVRRERILELSRRQLIEQRCSALAIDREQQTWQLDCAGLPAAAADLVPPQAAPKPAA